MLNFNALEAAFIYGQKIYAEPIKSRNAKKNMFKNLLKAKLNCIYTKLYDNTNSG